MDSLQANSNAISTTSPQSASTGQVQQQVGQVQGSNGTVDVSSLPNNALRVVQHCTTNCAQGAATQQATNGNAVDGAGIALLVAGVVIVGVFARRVLYS